jgi:hypothetical protein
MNFEVMCFDFINGSLMVVQKEYFDTLEEAIYFENTKGLNYVGGTSITPMNEWAEKQMEQFYIYGKGGTL